MLSFDPPELEQELRSAILVLSNKAALYLGDVEFGDKFGLHQFDDITITPETELQLYLPECHLEALSLSEAIELTLEVGDPNSFFDGLIFHSYARTTVCLNPNDGHTFTFVEALGEDSVFRAVLLYENTEVEIKFKYTSIQFSLAIVLKDYFFDKYFPPVTVDGVFVEVLHRGNLTKDGALGVIRSFLFELHSTHNLLFEYNSRGKNLESYEEESEPEVIDLRTMRIRPLLTGPGMSILMNEYLLGATANDYSTALVRYVKCIEYVSSTVVRQRQYDDLRKRLLDPGALNPTAEYMDNLLALFEENRQFTKDGEALKLCVERCCDPVILAEVSPACLKKLRSISSTSKQTDHKPALAELSVCLSATRNQQVHAKANYESTGNECPSDGLGALVNCARVAAEQCIRWYAAQNPELRRV